VVFVRKKKNCFFLFLLLGFLFFVSDRNKKYKKKIRTKRFFCLARMSVKERKTKRGAQKDLPSFHATQYSNYARSRRQQPGTPAHFRNRFMRFVEYPNGVYINHHGAIEALKPGEHRKLFAGSDSDSSSDDDENNIHLSDTEDSDVVEILQHKSAKKKKTSANENAFSIPEVSQTEEKTICVVCLEHPAVGVFQSCKHQCCCIKCGSKLEQCPICRAKTGFIHHLDVPKHVKTFK
jgi:hypothetical protein